MSDLGMTDYDELVFKAEDLYEEVMHKKRKEAIEIMEAKLIGAYNLGKRSAAEEEPATIQ